ncbi:hypothetical protein [Paractinoplanes atraurantiacus]|uniref:CARDB protein n=1 Tax=Paractinoplanes atraurantiacus TaxID=1036182 RepID=A0A285KLB6_9ACTN|nr:hypothetical protein [Actinoplanes atraurantiacus]SNY73408.1 hypothetical protein SAMN05421748_1472 [Actinoplanes atraurantiacus]
MRTSWQEDPTVPLAGDATPGARDAASPGARAQPFGAALLFEILAGVCGALLAAAFDGSAETRLLGAVIGTVVAALFTVAGPWLNVRAGAAVAITVIALLLTYGGGRAVSVAAGPGVDIFPPVPGPRKGGGSGGGTTPTTSPPATGGTCEGTLCIRVTPTKLACGPGPCGPVVVTNTGRKTLAIGEVEFTGTGARLFQHDGGCAGQRLQPKKSCEIRIAYTGAEDGTAKLVIHQNLKGPASRITLTGRGTTPTPSETTTGPPEPRPDLTLSTAKLRCSVVRNGALSGADVLAVDLAILNAGVAPVRRLVPFRLSSRTGITGRGSSGISDGTAVTAMQADLDPGDYNRTHVLTARVDPDDEIAESDEVNNRVTVAVALGSRPEAAADVPCQVYG